jgi:superfamily II DNA or RNA helicase
MLDSDNIFEILKQKKRVIKKEQTEARELFFQLRFSTSGACIHIVDAQNNEFDASYEQYSGATREVLKSIDNIQEKNSFRIDWKIPGQRINLADHEFMIWQLRHCGNFITEDQKPIQFIDESARLILRITEKISKNQKLLVSEILLRSQGNDFSDIQFINESHVYHDGQIFVIDPIGEHFQNVSLFQTVFLENDINKFLALFFSFFINIQVRYKKYKIIKGNPQKTTPIIIIEKISDDQALFLKISRGLPGFDEYFLEHYDIAKIAVINDLEKKIMVCDVLHGDVVSCFDEINALLTKHAKNETNGQFYVEDNLFIITETLAKSFVYNELPRLLSKYQMFGADKLKPYNVRAVQPGLNLNMNHGIDFLEGTVTLDLEGDRIALFDALRQYKKNAYIALNDGTHALVNKDYMEKLRRLFQKTEDDDVRVSFFDLPIVEELIDEKTAKEAFHQSREIFLGFNTIKSKKMRLPKLNAKLRNYQKQGYKWIKYLHEHQLGGCLADDMGLGKTLQAIAVLASIYPKEKLPSLVVMPKSLLFNWESEIKKFAPKLSFGVYYGQQRDFNQTKDKHVIMTTYAVLRNDIEMLKEKSFYYVILDESQHIKNPNAQTSKAAVLIQAKHRLGLSGTPVENNLGELYSLFRFLNPSMFGSIDQFNMHYATPIQKEGKKNALEELKKKIYPFILRRLKQDVLKDLPDKIEQVLYVEMSDPQKQFYEQRRLFYKEMISNQIEENGINKAQFYVFQALNELRQIASIPESKSDDRIYSPKREILIQHILDLVEQQHKMLVFANFLHALDCIAEDLVRHNIEFVHMTGATRDRKKLVEQFQEDDATQVFLMTLKTGGVGLNLTAADYIFLFDPWWNIAAENQAIDRSHRIGQDKTVFSYKLIARGSIEEKILELQNMKRELFDNLISSDGASIKSLDEEDIEFILGE